MRKTTGGLAQNYTMNYMQLGAQQGWQCPVCKRILAPFVPECPCQGSGKQIYTTTGTETIYLKNKGVITND